MQATLKIRNSNFYPVAVTSLSSQVQYMSTVVGAYVAANISLIPPGVSNWYAVLLAPCPIGLREEQGCGNALVSLPSFSFPNFHL